MQQKVFLAAIILLLSFSKINAQNVGIGTTSPNASAKLELSDANRGFLPPRVALVATNNTTTPVASPATGLMVYNTATAGSGTNAVSPGFYYFDGSNWVKYLSGTQAWQSTGNSGTAAGTNFIGTTDATDFVTKTNATEVMRATSGGNIGVGTTSPAEKLEVNGNIKATNWRSYGFNRTVPSNVNDAVDIGSFNFTNGGGFLDISIVVPSSGFSVSKYYALPIKYSQTGGSWVTVTPSNNSGSYSGNDFDMDYNVNGGTCSLRIRRTLGSTAGTAYVTLRHQGVMSDVFTSSTTVNTVSAPSTSTASNGVNSVSNASTANTLTTTVNGITGSTVNIVNSNSTSLSGTNLTSTVNGVAATALDISPAINATAWSKTGNSGSTASTNFIGTTDATDFVTKTNATEVMRATSGGNIGIGTTSPAEKLEVNGNIKATNLRTYGFNRTVPTAVNDAVDIGTFTFTNGGGYLDISIVVPSGGFSVSKYYALPIKYSQTSGAWVLVSPSNNTGSYSGNDFDMDYNVSGANCTLRIRRTAGNTAGTAYVTIHHQGVVSDAFTASTTVNTVSVPSTSTAAANSNWTQTGNSGLTAGNNFIGTTDAVDVVTKSNNTEVMRATSSGKVGIGVTSPAEVLDVNGNIKLNNFRTNGFTRTVPTAVNDAVDIGSFAFTNGGGFLDISIVVPSGSFSVSKYYALPIKFSQTGGAWVIVTPTGNTGSYSGNDFDMDYNVNGGTCSLRIRRTAGSTAGTAYVTIKQEGVVTDAFTASTTVNTVTVPTTSSNPAAANTNWSQTGNSGLTAGTNFIGTTDAVDVVTKSNNTEVMRATSGGNVGVGVSSPAEKLDINGDMRLGNLRTKSFTRTMPTAVNDAVDIGSFGFTNGGGILDVSIVVPSSSFSVSKKYLLAIKYSQTGGAWTVAAPVSNSDSYSGNDFALDAMVNGGTASLRIRRTAGSTAGTAYVTILQEGVNTDAFTSSSTVNTVTAPTTNFSSSIINQQSGNVGIGTSSPTSVLHVNGAIAAAINNYAGTNQTLSSTDYMAINTGGACTWTLPSASTCSGRMYILVNNGTGSITLSPAVTIANAATSNSLSNTSGSNRITVASDGTNWVRVQ